VTKRTIDESERALNASLGGLGLDFEAMRAISNIYLAANAVRNRVESAILKDVDLTWTAFVVLWVTWIWEEMEASALAAEVRLSKGTLSGVLTTLDARGLIVRSTRPEDKRKVVVSLSPAGKRMMKRIFPKFNSEETLMLGALTSKEVTGLASSLHNVVKQIQSL
jgi:DNA-binding MarR family transcriptional regulator